MLATRMLKSLLALINLVSKLVASSAEHAVFIICEPNCLYKSVSMDLAVANASHDVGLEYSCSIKPLYSMVRVMVPSCPISYTWPTLCKLQFMELYLSLIDLFRAELLATIPISATILKSISSKAPKVPSTSALPSLLGVVSVIIAKSKYR